MGQPSCCYNANAPDAICREAINKRRLKGKLKARICNDHGQWLYWLEEPIPG